jgi:hypothetical protein
MDWGVAGQLNAVPEELIAGLQAGGVNLFVGYTGARKSTMALVLSAVWAASATRIDFMSFLKPARPSNPACRGRIVLVVDAEQRLGAHVQRTTSWGFPASLFRAAPTVTQGQALPYILILV